MGRSNYSNSNIFEQFLFNLFLLPLYLLEAVLTPVNVERVSDLAFYLIIFNWMSKLSVTSSADFWGSRGLGF